MAESVRPRGRPPAAGGAGFVSAPPPAARWAAGHATAGRERPGARRHPLRRSLPGRQSAGRQAEPVVPFPPGAPPAARWGGGQANAAESGHPRASKLVDGSLVSCGCWRRSRRAPSSAHDGCRHAVALRIAARRHCWPPGRTGLTGFRPAFPPGVRWVPVRPRAGSVHPRGRKLVDGSAVSCGCWRPDPDARQAARVNDAGAGAHGDYARRRRRPLPGPTAHRPAEPVRLHPGVPPAPRWAAPCDRGPRASI